MTMHRVPTIGSLLWQLSIRWRVAVDRALSPLGITHAHYSLMASLYALTRDGEPPSQRELADFAGLDVMYVSKLVRSLEAAGLLKRADHRDDPRAFQLRLTDQGSKRTENAAELVQEVYDRLLKPIGGRRSKRHAALMQELAILLDHADALNQSGLA